MDARPPHAARPRWVCACVARLVILAGALVPGVCLGASYQTRNFSVQASTAEAARAVGEHAERCRQAIALAWLGKELPAWSRRCPITVKLTSGEAGGVTNFDFGAQGVADQEISVEGRLDRILASALPHEITHTVFAAYFGGPMPRWADEGASLLSEDDRELSRHDDIVLKLLARQGEMPLGQLFQQKEYPNDLWGFYGQGYSVSRFLVSVGGRPRFLQFVKDGMEGGWDASARRYYGFANCRELDRAWRSWHKVAMVESPTTPAAPVIIRAQNEPLNEIRRR